MANKELRDYLIVGTPPPIESDWVIWLVQKDPEQSLPANRPYLGYTYSQILNQLNGDVEVGFGQITGPVEDSSALVGYISDPSNITQDSTHRFVSDSQISNWNSKYGQEEVEDTIGTKVLGGANINVSYNDTTGETTIAATGLGTGDVVGPSSSVNNRVVFFDGTTGKLIKDSGLTLSGSNTGDETTASIKTKLGAASTSQDGYLTSADWNTFNGKQAALTAANFGSFINGLSSKSTIVDADILGITDSADSNNEKKTTATQLWTNYLKGKADSVYQPLLTADNFGTFTNGLSSKATVLDADFIGITDSADTNDGKKTTFLQIYENYIKAKVKSNINLQFQHGWSNATVSPLDNSSYYSHMFPINNLQATQGVYRTYVDAACVGYEVHFYASVGGTLASSETANLYLQSTTTGGVTTEVNIGTITLSSVNNSFYFTGICAIGATDYISIRMLTPTWATNPTSVLATATIRLLK